MKIYNEIVFDTDGNVIYEDSYEYSGDVMLLKDVSDELAESLRGEGIAAPSLPSISNVGSVPLTGVVNWSAVPGGFQPLPQTAGGNKKLYQLSQFHGGLNQRSSPRDIADIECQEATNISFSSIGRIKLLGTCGNTEYGSDVTPDSINANYTGYGLFVFSAPADQDGTEGEEQMVVAADGDEVSIHSSGGDLSAAFLSLGTTDDATVAQVYYASGSGLYVADANFDHANPTKCQVYVNRDDVNGNVAGWSGTEDNPLLYAPYYDDDATEADMAAGTVKAQSEGMPASGAAADGTLIGMFKASSTAGTWDAEYFFYVSWLFDNGCETQLTSFNNSATGTNAAASGVTYSTALDFNLSILHSNSKPLGGKKRIEGGRIYFKNGDEGGERFLLAEFNMIDGVRGALETTFTPWTVTSDVHTLSADMTFIDPPSVYTYASLNGYYATEMYEKSLDGTASEAAGAAPLLVRYKTAVSGLNGTVFIGNVEFDGKHMPDTMMYSMPGKPAVFPKFNAFDSPASDGFPITALAAFQDTILQFRQNAMHVINVANEGQFYSQAAYNQCGVHNPCQVFTTSFGVIFSNDNGVYIYDGQKVISLTDGKFKKGDLFGTTEDDTVAVAGSNLDTSSIGFDQRSQSIIVLTNIGHTATATGGWVYNMITQSWTESNDMIVNAGGNRHTNFILSPRGVLSLKRNDDGTLLNYNAIPQAAQTITYITKDIDFGFPSQTKKIFKIYVTYLGDGSSVTVTYGADGDTSPATALTNAENSGATLTSAGTGDHNVATFTLDSHPDNLKSIALKFTGSAAANFEINDISILYRLRPIK